jgi:hypothetical protein
VVLALSNGIEGEPMEKASSEQLGAAKPLLAPHERFGKYGSESLHLVHASTVGIHQLVNRPNLEKALINYDMVVSDTREWSEEQTQRYAEAKKLAAFAKKEIEERFPLLTGHSLVGLWGALEASFDDFLFVRLLTAPSFLRNPECIRFKVSALDLLSDSLEKRTRLVLHEITRNLGAEFKKGIARFEEPLNCVGLGGDVEPGIRKVILEMQQLRHIWAHRGGVADDRFKETCPWVKVEVGERAKIHPETFADYSLVALAYFTAITNRALRERGLYLKQGELYRLDS